LLRLRVRIPPGDGRLSCEYCVLSGRSICDEPIHHLGES